MAALPISCGFVGDVFAIFESIRYASVSQARRKTFGRLRQPKSLAGPVACTYADAYLLEPSRLRPSPQGAAGLFRFAKTLVNQRFGDAWPGRVVDRDEIDFRFGPGPPRLVNDSSAPSRPSAILQRS